MFLWYIAALIVFLVVNMTVDWLGKAVEEDDSRSTLFFVIPISLAIVCFQLYIFGQGLYAVFGPGY